MCLCVCFPQQKLKSKLSTEGSPTTTSMTFMVVGCRKLLELAEQAMKPSSLHGGCTWRARLSALNPIIFRVSRTSQKAAIINPLREGQHSSIAAKIQQTKIARALSLSTSYSEPWLRRGSMQNVRAFLKELFSCTSKDLNSKATLRR